VLHGADAYRGYGRTSGMIGCETFIPPLSRAGAHTIGLPAVARRHHPVGEPADTVRAGGSWRRASSGASAGRGGRRASGPLGDLALHLAEYRVGCIASAPVLLRRHVGHVAAPQPRLPRGGDDRRLAIIVGWDVMPVCCLRRAWHGIRKSSMPATAPRRPDCQSPAARQEE